MTPTRDTGWTNAVLAANVVDPEVARTRPAKERATWLIDRKNWTVRLENFSEGTGGTNPAVAANDRVFWRSPRARSGSLQRHQRRARWKYGLSGLRAWY
jgi:hypothetical protein